MPGQKAISALSAAAALVNSAAAKAVFAHYMVSSASVQPKRYFIDSVSYFQVGTVTQEHAAQDIDDAMALG